MLTVDDLRTIESRTDLAFENGAVVGKIFKTGVKKSFRWTTVIVMSIVLTVFFFIVGFISSKKNHK